MEDVTDTKLYKYENEVIVELLGTDSRGDFAIVSYRFSFAEGDDVVRAKGEIGAQDTPHVETALERAGYAFDRQ
jgi:hypothetical protein